jgi:hypothetical protein
VKRVLFASRSGVGKTTVANPRRDQQGFYVARGGELCHQFPRLFFGSGAKSVLNSLTDTIRQIDLDAWINAVLRTLPARCPATTAVASSATSRS